jgi:hypothetical protein
MMKQVIRRGSGVPKEIRAILFTADEVRTVVDDFLRKGAAGRKVQSVELEVVKGAVHGRARLGRGADAKLTVLGPQDMMTAVLMYCRGLRIPLASRAVKQLEIASTGLMLTMSLSQESSAPRVNGNAVEYTAPLPDAMNEALATVRE